MNKKGWKNYFWQQLTSSTRPQKTSNDLKRPQSTSNEKSNKVKTKNNLKGGSVQENDEINEHYLDKILQNNDP